MIKFICDNIIKLLTGVTFPAALTLLVTLVVFIFYLRRKLRYLLGLFIILFYLAANGTIPRWLIKPLENHFHPVTQTAILSHRVLIVSGDGISPSPQQTVPSIVSYSRLFEAVKIYRYALQKGIRYTIILSGGPTSKGKPTEAMVYRDALLKMGIPTKQIVLENRSKNTFQNAQFTKTLLQQRHIDKALLVSSSLHMRRDLQFFRYFNIDVTAAVADFPYPRSSWWPLTSNLLLTEMAMHEWYGIGQMKIYNFFGLNKPQSSNS